MSEGGGAEEAERGAGAEGEASCPQMSRSQLWAAGAAGAEGEALVEDGVGVATPE